MRTPRTLSECRFVVGYPVIEGPHRARWTERAWAIVCVLTAIAIGAILAIGSRA